VLGPSRSLARIAAPTNGDDSAPSSEWRGRIKGVAEGVRNDTITRLTGHLLRRRIYPPLALELMHAWNATRCAPPLPANDVETIVNSIAGRELKRRQADGD
jgi:hypothetical protein